MLGVEELFESKGVRPDQVVDMLALMGDPTDNVPGVKGVGIKTAAKLINERGGIDGIYASLDEFTPKLRENLAANEDLGAAGRNPVRVTLGRGPAGRLE